MLLDTVNSVSKKIDYLEVEFDALLHRSKTLAEKTMRKLKASAFSGHIMFML